MFWKSKEKLRPLRESEIQEKVYGAYIGKEPKEKKASENLREKLKKTLLEKEDIEKELEKTKRKLLKAEVALSRARQGSAVYGSFPLDERIGKVKEYFFNLPQKTMVALIVGFLTAFILLGIVCSVARKTPAEKPPERSLSRAVTSTRTKKTYAIIQVCTYKKKEDAQKLVEMLTKKRYPAFAEESKSPAGKRLYIVYVGNFATPKDAAKSWDRIKRKEGFEDSYIIKRH